MKPGLFEILKEARKARVASAYATVYGDIASPSSWSEAYHGTRLWEEYSVTNDHAAFTVHSNTQFDLASLTKPLVTTMLVMKLVEKKRLRLDQTLSNFFDELPKSFQNISIQSLLCHDSGLIPWHPFYENLRFLPINERNSTLFALLQKFPPLSDKVGTVQYSDLGFLWLFFVLRKMDARSLHRLARDELFAPMNLDTELHFRPLGTHVECDPAIVATELCPWRGLLQGAVHDDNAYSMGGVSSHAGLFGSARAVALWLRQIAMAKVVSQNTLQIMWSRATDDRVNPRTPGWDMPAPNGNGSTGFALSPWSVGHLGYTGTSVWIDLVTGKFAVLLTNRVHPSRSETTGIRELRRAFHAKVFSV